MSLTELLAEQWMSRHLELGLNWDSGVTTREQRRELIRAAILRGNLNTYRAGARDGRPETWAQLFQRVYRQPLTTETKE